LGDELPNFEIKISEKDIKYKIIYGGFRNEFYKEIIAVIECFQNSINSKW
jgi:hypothetical protein